MHSRVKVSIELTCLLLWGGMGSAIANPASAADGATETTLEEVIVTATKRAESIQTVPTAVTAISSSDIVKQGLMQFSDYADLVPGLAQNSTGAAGHGLVILRGLSSGNSQSSSTVAFIIDDVPFTANTSAGDSALITPDPDLADIERIEVLKGPQGTLYGASALGGIIKIVSKQPTADDFSADVHADWSSVDHGGNGGGMRASVNIPLISDVAALRVSAFERTDPGFMKNVETGAQETNKAITSGGKMMLKIDPTSHLSVVFSGLIQNSHTDAGAQVQTDSTTLTPLYCRLCYADAVGQSFDTQYRLGGMVVSWNSSFGTLTNALSYAKYSDSETAENLGFGFVNQQLPVPANTVAIATPDPSMEKLTEELRFATVRVDNFEGLGGLYFTNEKSGYDVALTDRVPPTLAAVAPPFDNILTSNTAALYKEYAAFGDLTYYFLPALDFTVGGRISHDQQSASTFGDGILLGPPTTTVFGSNENPVTYLATIRYRPADDVDTYARFATGYRPGGPQTTNGPGIPPSFKPDTTKNYELGVKTRWLDGRLTANAALYYIRWNDIQLDEIIDGLTVLGNGGKATSKGVEFDLAFIPIHGFTTQLSSSYDHAVSDTAVPAVGAVAGDTLPFAPRFTMAALADYDFPLVGSIGGNVGATYSYQGSRPTSFSEDEINLNRELPGYATLNLRAGIEWSKYSAQLRINNATDKYAYTTSSVGNLFPGQGVPAQSIVLTPRTLVLELNAKF
jgi:iron complex outermembrane receptor protein